MLNGNLTIGLSSTEAEAHGRNGLRARYALNREIVASATL